MGSVQDPSAGLVPLAWRWRGALAALVIGGGVMAAANAESLGLLNIDFSPGQTTELNAAAPPSDGGAAASRPRTPARARSADAPPPGSAWTASGRVLRIAGANLTLDWAGAPPTASDEEATDGQLHDPEFASISSPVGTAENVSAARFEDSPSLANAAGGGLGSLGSLGGGPRAALIATKAPDAANAVTDASLPAAVDPPLAAGPVPEPATWATMILGLGLAGAMLRNARRSRRA